ncbi:MAG: hypothetical protein ACRELV_11320 [Longimicrobiales bacterium]
MAEVTGAPRTTTVAGVSSSSNPAYQAFRALQIGFIAAPIIAGLDKFFGLLTDWSQYLWPGITDLLGVAPAVFMSVVGVVEIIAGLVVAFKPRFGGYLVAAWLVGIILNLLLLGDYWDIALRDLGLAIGAFALARLATTFD